MRALGMNLRKLTKVTVCDKSCCYEAMTIDNKDLLNLSNECIRTS